MLPYETPPYFGKLSPTLLPNFKLTHAKTAGCKVCIKLASNHGRNPSASKYGSHIRVDRSFASQVPGMHNGKDTRLSMVRVYWVHRFAKHFSKSPSGRLHGALGALPSMLLSARSCKFHVGTQEPTPRVFFPSIPLDQPCSCGTLRDDLSVCNGDGFF